MSEAFAEQFPESSNRRIIKLPGIISDGDLGLQEYSGDLLKPDIFLNPALRHDMSADERQHAEESNNDIWEG